MTDKKDEQPPAGLVGGMPKWVSSIVFALSIPTLVIVFSAKILDISPGKHIDRLLEMKFEQMRLAIDNSAANTAEIIIQEFGARLERIEARLTSMEEQQRKVPVLEMRIGILEEWACLHADNQRLTNDRPTFCKIREQ